MYIEERRYGSATWVTKIEVPLKDQAMVAEMSPDELHEYMECHCHLEHDTALELELDDYADPERF